MSQLNILIVDDDDADRKMMRRLIRSSGADATVYEARSRSDMMTLDLPQLDAVFLDYLLPDSDGLTLLDCALERWPGCAAILMTGQGNEELAKSAIILGAIDYVPKGALTASAVTRMLDKGVGTARLRHRLREKHAELETFSETLVHDLKAPIRAVGFFADQIEEDLQSGDAEGVADALRLVRKATRQMRELIESLADYVRHDREVVLEPADLKDLFDRSVTSLDREISDAGADVAFEGSAGPIDCSAPQISQLLQNLIGNAIKYRSARAPQIVVSVAEQPDALHVTVTDNGMGVSPEYRGRIFEPFKRLSHGDGPAGTGLGLATCRKIVQRHGGRIWCDGAEGGGTAIHFLLMRDLQEPTRGAMLPRRVA